MISKIIVEFAYLQVFWLKFEKLTYVCQIRYFFYSDEYYNVKWLVTSSTFLKKKGERQREREREREEYLLVPKLQWSNDLARGVNPRLKEVNWQDKDSDMGSNIPRPLSHDESCMIWRRGEPGKLRVNTYFIKSNLNRKFVPEPIDYTTSHKLDITRSSPLLHLLREICFCSKFPWTRNSLLFCKNPY